MKRVLQWMVLLFIVCAAPVAHAQFSDKQEHIKEYYVTIDAKESGVLEVTEKIHYQFPGWRHGIYRTIPTEFLSVYGDVQRLLIRNVEVTDEHGTPYKIQESYLNDDIYNVRIGDPNQYVEGAHWYYITYTVYGAFAHGNTDVLYWNAIGTDWSVGTQKAEVRITFPRNSLVKSKCFRGTLNSENECMRTETAGSVYVQNIGSLYPTEGISLKLDFKDGVFKAPNILDKLWMFFAYYWLYFLPLVVFVSMYRIWKREGKDPEGRGVIVPQYEVIDNFTPVEVSAMMYGKIDKKMIAAEIIALAVKGYVKITQYEYKFFFTQKSYYIDLVKEIKFEDLPEHEYAFLTGLFDHKKRIDLRELKGDLQKQRSFALILQSMMKKLMNNLIVRGYYRNNPVALLSDVRILVPFMRDILIIGVSTFLLFISYPPHGVSIFIAPAVSVILYIIFFSIMRAPTVQGVHAIEHIKGLKDYLQIAEKDRLVFHNAPEKTPEIFEKFLPYAIILGVDTAWVKEFEDISIENLDWYTSSTGEHLSYAAFVSGISDFGTSFTSAAVPVGSSGGGGAGGGGGGGGGGSW